MTTPIYQALIVDDEPISCKMMTFALTQEGFSCDAAKDGEEALLFCRHREYDLVVTDLVMPNRNGHSLAVDLLAGKSRPVVIVHTSVTEPRLTKDLLLRGVDEVVYKPTNYKALATRALAMVTERKRVMVEETNETPVKELPAVDISDIESRLAQLTDNFPVSKTAFEVYELAGSDEISGEQIAAVIAEDPALQADVLWLAGSFYSRCNPATANIDTIEDAAICVGQKRLGEFALASGAFRALTSKPISWLNAGSAWQRSIASAVAIDLLLSRGVYPGIGEGLFLSAMMHNFGRIALGVLYPQIYRQLTERCLTTMDMLDAWEDKLFPVNRGQVVAMLFKAWKIPSAICRPLQYTSNSYSSLASFKDPLRTKVELLKLALFLSQISAELWDCWDTVEFPPSSAFRRLHIESLPKLIEDIRLETKAIIDNRMRQAKENAHSESSAASIVKYVRYCNFSADDFDFLREVVASMGITLTDGVPNIMEPGQNFLVNCLWNPPQRYNSVFSTREHYGAKLIVTDPNHELFYKNSGDVIPLPASYGKLQEACAKVARHADSLPPKPVPQEADA